MSRLRWQDSTFGGARKRPEADDRKLLQNFTRGIQSPKSPPHHPGWRIMRYVIVVAAVAASCTRVAMCQPQGECEIDLGGPMLTAYQCAERRARAADDEMQRELAAALAAAAARQQRGAAVTKGELAATQAAWQKHVQSHCRFAARLPGEPGDWRFTVILENACLIERRRERAVDLRRWSECLSLGGQTCMP
jgi:uncharacterized protein YecT (DUF1311 family)